jgi:hypothetical protein
VESVAADASNAVCCYVCIPATSQMRAVFYIRALKFLFENRVNVELKTLVPVFLSEHSAFRSDAPLPPNSSNDKMVAKFENNLCGGGVEYLHREPASRKRRRNGTKKAAP